MSILDAIILSIVEGITEFLPISSTGHMILAADLLKIPQTEFLKSFEIIIQFGAILAVVSLYLKVLLTNRVILTKLLVAFIPAGVVGLVLYKFIKSYLLGSTSVVLWSLFIGGVILIAWEKYYQTRLLDWPRGHYPFHGVARFRGNDNGDGGNDKYISHDQKQILRDRKIEELSYKKAFIIGIFQSLSVIPGVSRAAATIVGAMSVGLSRKAAVEFSFLLAVPTMAGATGLDLVKSSFNFSKAEWGILGVGFVGAFITALIAVKFFLRFIERHTFVLFGIYRIVLAVLFWMVVIR